MSSSDNSSDSKLLSNLNTGQPSTATSPSSKRKDSKTGQKRKGAGDRNSHVKSSRPIFLDRRHDRFKPWLAKDKVDPQRLFCKACRCRFNCTKLFYLKRHEQTSKHQFNLVSYLSAKSLQPDMYDFGQRKERKKKAPKVKTKTDASKFESVFVHMLDNEQENDNQMTMPDFEHTHEDGNESGSTSLHLYDQDSVSWQKENVQMSENGIFKRLLLEIHKVKDDIIASFNELFSKAFDKKERNHVDLFFDSVASSIKTLPPSLVAESKMRVSQLVCEMELRAITESGSNTVERPLVLISAPLENAYVISKGEAVPNESNKD